MGDAIVRRTAGDPSDSLYALTAGTELLDFKIERVIGEGGFSIVYLAFDQSLQRRIAIKEYLPRDVAFRRDDGTVAPRSPKHQETFEAGRQGFLEEARLLARFEHPALIRVIRYGEANGTAYIATFFYPGVTLRELIKNDRARASETSLKALMHPLLDAVEMLHAKQCFHRDIAPDNIIVQPHNYPVLLDFGAARRIIGDMTHALTAVIKPGYAPLEQYADEGGLIQGPWTDVYGFAALLYWAVMGTAPAASVARAIKDTLPRLHENPPPGYSVGFLRAIDHGLALRPAERPQTIAAFREELGIPREPDFDRTVLVGRPGRSSQPHACTDTRVTMPGAQQRIALVTLGAFALVLALALLFSRADWHRSDESVATVETASGSSAIAPTLNSGGRVGMPPATAPGDRDTNSSGSSSAERTIPVQEGTASGQAHLLPQDESVATSSSPPAATAKQRPSDISLPASGTQLPPKRPAAQEQDRASTTKAGGAGAQPTHDAPVTTRPATPPTEIGKVDPLKPRKPNTNQIGGTTKLTVPDLGTAAPRASPAGPSSQPTSAKAQFELATNYAKGTGVTQDDAAAVTWFRKAAEQGYAPAQNRLGLIYYNGFGGVQRDQREAANWYLKAAAQGDASAQMSLGFMYANGIGVLKDEAAAIGWYRKSAEQGNAFAQNHLGDMLAGGRGVMTDVAEAALWYRKAADAGNNLAQASLGRMYETGIGVASDVAEARKWYALAAARGNVEAASRLKALQVAK